MEFRTKLAEFKFKFSLKEYYSCHYLLFELYDGKVIFIDTRKPKEKRQFDSLTDYEQNVYIRNPDIDVLKDPISILHYTEITNTNQGRQIKERYPTIKRVHLKKIE